MVTEPATLLTDFLLTVLSWWFAGLLTSGRVDVTRRWWVRAFLFIGAGALAGGVWHGFHQHLSPLSDSLLWRLCLVLTIGSSLCLWHVVLTGFLLERHQATWSLAGGLKAGVALTVALVRPEFLVVLTDFALSMLFLALSIVATGSLRRPGAGWLLAGVAAFALGGMVQFAGLAPHPSFNHNDLFHVIQLAGNTLFFLGARRG